MYSESGQTDARDEAAEQRISMLEVRCAELEADLARANESLNAYFDFAFVGIIETDGAFKILRANQAALSFLGLSLKAVQMRHIADVLHTNERYLTLLHEQGIAYTEINVVRENGNAQQLVLNSIQSNESHFIHFFDDVTEQRQASAATKLALNAAENSDRAKSAFLANISHEIRTPLNGIIGLSKLAKMANHHLRNEYLEKIHESGQILLRIVNDLLDYAKVEAGAMTYEYAPMMLDDLLDDVVACLGHHHQPATIDFAFIPDLQVPEMLMGDRMRVAQCLSNLANNALKFTQAGHVYVRIGLDLTATDKKVHFSVEDTGIGIAPEVLSRLFVPFAQADVSTARRYGGTGLGLALVKQMVEGMGGELHAQSTLGVGTCFSFSLPMLSPTVDVDESEGRVAEDVKPKLIERALVVLEQDGSREAIAAMLTRRGWEVHVTQDASFDVRGVDLLITDDSAIALNILRSDFSDHPMVLVVSGEPETELPLGCRHLNSPVLPHSLFRSLASDLSAPAELFIPPDEFSGIHVLVAEDNPVNQKLIIALLELAGIQVSLAKNGSEALALMELLTPSPSVILMDVQMPEMDGLQATSKLRAAGFELPIIAMSAGVSHAERNRCEQAGFSDFIAKPIDFDELWGVMTRWVPPNAIRSAAHEVTAPIDVLRPVIDVFIQHHADTAQRMAQMLENSDWKGIGYITHQIKGIAPSVGADAILSLCLQIEVALADANIDVLNGLIADFASAYSDFVERHRQSLT